MVDGFNSKNYWENRYQNNGNSGLGSYGSEAEFKANYINDIIAKFGIKTITDFGCGDGNQISLLKGFEQYNGYDFSPKAVNICAEKFKEDSKYNFEINPDDLPVSDVTMSLDVTYHIIEDDYFEAYMHNLFKKSNKFVLIYSVNSTNNGGLATHLKNRLFVDWIKANYPMYEQINYTKFEGKTNGVGFFLFAKQD
jgi:SAM-dependent methyltransferase